MELCEVTHVIDVGNFSARLGTDKTFNEFRGLQQAINAYCDGCRRKNNSLHAMHSNSASPSVRWEAHSTQSASFCTWRRVQKSLEDDLEPHHLVFVLMEQRGCPLLLAYEADDNVWCRATVTFVDRAARQIGAYLIDFGWCQMTSLDHVMFDCPTWMLDFPAFARNYSLAGVHLSTGDLRWPTVVVQTFVGLVERNVLYALLDEESNPESYPHTPLRLWTERPGSCEPGGTDIADAVSVAYVADLQRRNFSASYIAEVEAGSPANEGADNRNVPSLNASLPGLRSLVHATAGEDIRLTALTMVRQLLNDAIAKLMTGIAAPPTSLLRRPEGHFPLGSASDMSAGSYETSMGGDAARSLGQDETGILHARSQEEPSETLFGASPHQTPASDASLREFSDMADATRQQQSCTGGAASLKRSELSNVGASSSRGRTQARRSIASQSVRTPGRGVPLPPPPQETVEQPTVGDCDHAPQPQTAATDTAIDDNIHSGLQTASDDGGSEANAEAAPGTVDHTTIDGDTHSGLQTAADDEGSEANAEAATGTAGPPAE